MEKSIELIEGLNRKNIEHLERLEKEVASIKAQLLRLLPRKQNIKLVKS